MRTLRQLPIVALSALLGICLSPRAALAHGGELLGPLMILSWAAAAIPWAAVVYLVARRGVVEETRRPRLGPLTVMTTVIAIFGGFGITALSGPTRPEPIALGPLLLVVSGAPGLWYLWRHRSYDVAIAFLVVPLIAMGTCGAVMWSSR